MIFLFEFYANTNDEYRSEYKEYKADSLAKAENKLIEDYPDCRILGTYIPVNERFALL
jgi:hypothetical protein